MVRSPFTISTRAMMCTGLKKWSPTKRPGDFSPAPISVTDSDDVFVARMVRAPATASTFAKIRFLSAITSGTASITRSAPSTASPSLPVPARRASAPSRVASATLPRRTPLSRVASIPARARSSCPAVHIAQHGLVARHRRHLRDSAAHRPRADHGHLPERGHRHLSPAPPRPRSPGRPRCTSWRAPARRPGVPSRAPASPGCARRSTPPGAPARWRRR